MYVYKVKVIVCSNLKFNIESVIKMQNLVEEFLPNNSCRYHDAFEDAKNLGAIIGEACKKKEISIREFLQVKHKNLYLLE